jgi:divinyl chlorophyllide a 8-vinyl-reductase
VQVNGTTCVRRRRTGYIGRQLISQLLARGHRILALAHHGSQAKLPEPCEIVIGNLLDRLTFIDAISPCDTFVRLVGVPHPSPHKAQQFPDIALRSAAESIEAARGVGIAHFVYVSVAQLAPVMRAYQAARRQAEELLDLSGLRRTILVQITNTTPVHGTPVACAIAEA